MLGLERNQGWRAVRRGHADDAAGWFVSIGRLWRERGGRRWQFCSVAADVLEICSVAAARFWGHCRLDFAELDSARWARELEATRTAQHVAASVSSTSIRRHWATIAIAVAGSPTCSAEFSRAPYVEGDRGSRPCGRVRVRVRMSS